MKLKKLLEFSSDVILGQYLCYFYNFSSSTQPLIIFPVSISILRNFEDKLESKTFMLGHILISIFTWLDRAQKVTQNNKI